MAGPPQLSAPAASSLPDDKPWGQRLVEAFYGAATCGSYAKLQRDAQYLQNTSVSAEATLLRLQCEAASTEQAEREAQRAHEIRLLELKDQPEARRVLHEERMAAEATKQARIAAEERAAIAKADAEERTARHAREAQLERERVAMQLWVDAQRGVYERVVDGHTRLYERVVADVAAGYMEVDGEHPWSALTDAWFGKRLLTIEKALQLPKTRQRAAQELQRIVEFRMSLQGLMAPGDQLRQCAPGSALRALTDGSGGSGGGARAAAPAAKQITEVVHDSDRSGEEEDGEFVN